MHAPVRSLLQAVLVMAALLAAGCATSYRFKVDAVRSAEPTDAGASYKIVSANPEMGEGNLRFQEAAKYVKTALSSKGMYEAPPGTEPAVIIELDFGIEEPRTVYKTESEPEYMMTAGGSHVEMVKVHNPKTGTVAMVPMVFYDPPQREIVAFRERQIAVTVYDKYVRITARETPEQAGDRPPRELWSVYVSNDDETSDLREYLPLMVSAAMDSMDQNTNAQKEVVISDDDKRVEFVKQGL